MTVASTRKFLNAIVAASDALGQDATLRQLQTLLYVAQSGSSGIDGVTLEKLTGSSQAATSRALKLFGPQLGMIEFFLDQADGRRRLARLTPKGERALESITSHVEK